MRLSNARSEWGSCNARGEIRLNWRLVQLPPALAEYVVAHEVAHLVELNHSPRFWAIVETLMPGHAALRRELEDWTALLGGVEPRQAADAMPRRTEVSSRQIHRQSRLLAQQARRAARRVRSPDRVSRHTPPSARK